MRIWLYCVCILFVSQLALSQDLPSSVSANIQLIEEGSYLIPTDAEKQSTALYDSTFNVPYTGFNLAAYGLVYKIMEANIPVQWVIRSDKEKDEPDVTASSHQLFPSSGPIDDFDYRSGLFVIKAEDVGSLLSCVGFVGYNPLDNLISTFANDVSVYYLDEDVEMDVRYELLSLPTVAVLEDGPTLGAPHFTMLNDSKIPYDLLGSADFFEEYSCYTFISQPHLANIVNPLYISSLDDFLTEGGNFFAHCVSIREFEDDGTFLTSTGINVAAANNTNNESYEFDFPDMPYMQFEGTIPPYLQGQLSSFELETGSEWEPFAYVCGYNQDDELIMAAGDYNGVEAGGNIFYMSGHEISSGCFELHLENPAYTPVPADFEQIQQFKRTYFNALFTPSGVFYACAGKEQCICVGDEVELGCSNLIENGEVEYYWEPELGLSCTDCPRPIASPTETTTYTLSTNSNCNESIVTVFVFPDSEINLTGDTEHCGEGVDLSIDFFGPDVFPFYLNYEGHPIGYYTDETSPIIVNVTDFGYYSIAPGAPVLCNLEISDPLLIQPDTSDWNLQLPNDTTVCKGESISFVAQYTDLGQLAQWQNEASGNTQNTDTAGLFIFTLSNNLCEVSDSILIDFQSPSEIDLGPDLLLCEGDSIELLVSHLSGETIEWQDGSTSNSFTVKENGIYWAEISLGNCSETDSIEITFLSPPLINLGNDLEFCEGDNALISLPSSNGYLFNWEDGGTDSPRTISGSGTLVVYGTNNLCEVQDTLFFETFAVPQPDLGNDQSICEGDSILLIAKDWANFNWSNGATNDSVWINEEAIIWLEYYNNNCSKRDSIIINLFTPPTIDLGADISFCEGESELVYLPVATDYTFSWADGEIESPRLISGDGTIIVLGTNGICELSDSLFFETIVVPQPNLGSDLFICEGDSTLIVAQNWDNYSWSNGSLNDSLWISEESTIWLDYVNDFCSKRDSLFIDLLEIPDFNLGPDIYICEGNTTELGIDLGPEFSYSWNTAEESAIIETGIADTYVLSVSSGSCSKTDSIHVFTLSIPPFDLGKDTLLCSGDSLFLEAADYFPLATGLSIEMEHLWSTGSEESSILVSYADEYSVEITWGDCYETDTINVTIQRMPNIHLGPDIVLCPGDSVELTSNVESSYSVDWNTGLEASSIWVNDAGIYEATVSILHCEEKDSIEVVVPTLPILDLGPDIVLCPGEEYALNAAAEGIESFVWQDGSSDSLLLVSSAGIYSVSAWTENLCELNDSVTVGYEGIGSANLGPDFTLCEEETALLSPLIQGDYEFIWQDGSSDSVFLVEGPGEYSIIADGPDCLKMDTIVVSYDPLPGPPDLGPDLLLCDLVAVDLDGSSLNVVSYDWSTGETSESIFIDDVGSYYLTVSNSCGERTDSITIESQFELNSSPFSTPSAFSPNFDGHNDRFLPIPSQDFEVYYYDFQVYDRWGNCVFAATEPGVPWEGLNDQQSGALGVYLWYIQVVYDRCGIQETFFDKGHVSLIR